MSNEPIIIEQIQLSEVSESAPIVVSNTVDNLTQEENKKPKKSKSKRNSNDENKDKKEQANPYLRTFTIHIKQKQDVIMLRNAILDYKHLENMIIILINLCKKDQEYRAADLLLNNITMKAVLKQTEGGEATKDDILYLNNKLKKYDLFQTVLNYVEDKNINGHNISMLVRRLKKDFKNHEDRLEKGVHSNAPKPKKINKINSYSLPLASEKWSLAKKDYVGLNFFDKMVYIYCPFKGKLDTEHEQYESKIKEQKNKKNAEARLKRKQEKEKKKQQEQQEKESLLEEKSIQVYIQGINQEQQNTNKEEPTIVLQDKETVKQIEQVLKGSNIQSINVSLSNAQVYLNFTYDKSDRLNKNIELEANDDLLKLNQEIDKALLQDIKKDMPNKSQVFKGIKAGLDVGLIHFAALFIDDDKDNSLLFSGRRFIKYNCFYNKQISDINEEMAKHVLTYKQVTQKDGTVIKIPTEYKQHGKQLKNKKRLLTEKRNRFFDEEFLQYAIGIIKYLKHYDVKYLVISKNLSFAKKDGELDMNKKTKQKFYQIPFGRFLNMLECIGKEHGIEVVDCDEAYTSKSSCLSDNVALKQKELKGKKSSVTDFSGSRTARGLYHDKPTNLRYNADMNGSANHIKVIFNDVEYRLNPMLKRKLASPLTIKSNLDLQNRLRVMSSTCTSRIETNVSKN